MAVTDVVVRIAGEGGEGVISVGQILAQTAAHASLEVFTYRTFPAEIKGGLAMIQVRLNLESISSMGQDADILMAFNQEAFDFYSDKLTSKGIVIYDPKLVTVPEGFSHRTYPNPINDTAMEQTGGKLSKNIVALASLIKILDIPEDKAKELVISKFMKKGEAVLNANMKAFDAGFESIKDDFDHSQFKLVHPEARGSEVIISGNQAIALGAIAAGCNYVAGYPITPATSILEFLMAYLPNLGGTVLQFEDEIAAIGSCLGASFTGAKVLTATSGPGLALMGELINMASMVELPVVLVDVQRGGPSTGLPTKTEQSDLNYAIYGATGEAPRAVIAPTTIEDCFYQTIKAFNIAEKYQIPVILLSDQSMAYRTKSVDIPELDSIEIIDRLKTKPKKAGEFKRFADSPTGVSPLTVPGTPNGMYIATGLEHDEAGAPNYRPVNHELMMKKRYRKLDTLSKELENGNGIDNAPENAEIGLISWGGTEGPIREAIAMAERDGISVAHLQPKVLNPLPKKMISDFISSLKKVLVLEENFTGQFSHFLKGNFDMDPISITKCQGVPFTTEDVYGVIKKHACSAEKV